jgi:hypothetical protein
VFSETVTEKLSPIALPPTRAVSGFFLLAIHLASQSLFFSESFFKSEPKQSKECRAALRRLFVKRYRSPNVRFRAKLGVFEMGVVVYFVLASKVIKPDYSLLPKVRLPSLVNVDSPDTFSDPASPTISED